MLFNYFCSFGYQLEVNRDVPPNEDRIGLQLLMLRKNISLFIIFLTLNSLRLWGQCTITPPPAGIFCDPGIANGAPLLCDLDCLDGYIATMPAFDPNDPNEGQPNTLCEDMGDAEQGQPDNMSWFAFIAGTDDILFEIIPTCPGNPDSVGVQAGIYGDCEGIEKLYCRSDRLNEPFEIGGPGFVPGRTYYMFIDGYLGSQCDYEVKVLRGTQPYPLPDITGIDVQYSDDTICRGANVTIALEGLNQDSITYNYTIDPSTTDYPDGKHPDSLHYVTDWVFNEEGEFVICVQATNGCDLTPIICDTVFIQSIEDEVFSDVEVCIEDLGSYMGPVSEDPNGDGVVGWMGSTRFIPGINRDTIVDVDGCYYVQEININIIDGGVREDVVIHVCSDDFPVDYQGQEYDSPMENVNISLDNIAQNGCDSLVNLSIVEVNVEGEIIVEDCENDEVLLSFIALDYNPILEPQMKIYWQDENNVNLTDPDEVNFEVTVSQSGTYSIIFEYNNSTTCQFIITSDFIDFDDLKPSIPVPLNWEVNPCYDNDVIVYRVAAIDDPTAEYQWTYPSDIRGVIDDGVDSVSIDWGDSEGGEVCVSVATSCGQSEMYCQDIEVRSLAVVNIFIPDSVCIGDTFDISTDGDSGWDYNWDFKGGQVLSTNDINGPGPHTMVYNQEDNIEVDLILNDGVCNAIHFSASLNILSVISPPEVLCSSTGSEMTFSWEDVPGAIGYEVDIIHAREGISSEMTNNSITINNLNDGDSIALSIITLSEGLCGRSEPVIASCVAECLVFDMEVPDVEDMLCVDSSSAPFSIFPRKVLDDALIIFSDTAVQSTGLILPYELSDGYQEIIVKMEVDGCIYLDTVNFLVEKIPDWSFFIEQPNCGSNELGTLSFIPATTSNINPFNYFIDGEQVIEDDVQLPVGNYTLTAETNSGCISETEISITLPMLPGMNIIGDSVVDEGSEVQLELIGEEPFSFDSIVWTDPAGQIICSSTVLADCRNISFIPESGGLSCAEIHYLGNCSEIFCVLIQTRRVIRFYAPNIFTPNEDGYNDFFFFQANHSDIMLQKVRIFDRWGGVVFTRDNVPLEDVSARWNGNIGEKEAPEGVYVYLVEYADENNQPQIVTGNVTIIR